MAEPPLKDRLLTLRLSLKLRQKELASKLDVPLSSYRNWEYGKKVPDKLAMAELNRRIASILPPKVRLHD